MDKNYYHKKMEMERKFGTKFGRNKKKKIALKSPTKVQTQNDKNSQPSILTVFVMVYIECAILVFVYII